MAPPLAHAGHWLAYTAPIIVVLAAVVASAVRERRGRAMDVEDGGERPEEDGA